jgi:hypothetical protein
VTGSLPDETEGFEGEGQHPIVDALAATYGALAAGSAAARRRMSPPRGEVQFWICLNPAHGSVEWAADGSDFATCTVCGLTSDMTREFAEVCREVNGSRQILWDILLATGFDPDGDTEVPPPGVYTPDIPELALRYVRELREDWDQACAFVPDPGEVVVKLADLRDALTVISLYTPPRFRPSVILDRLTAAAGEGDDD